MKRHVTYYQTGMSVIVFLLLLFGALGVVVIGNQYFRQKTTVTIAEKTQVEESRIKHDPEPATQQKLAEGGVNDSQWVEIICYEKQSILPIIDPDKGELHAFQEGGSVVVVRPGGPEEVKWPAQITRDQVIFHNPTAKHAVFTIDRVGGTIIYENRGELVMRGTCLAAKSRHF